MDHFTVNKEGPVGGNGLLEIDREIQATVQSARSQIDLLSLLSWTVIVTLM